MDESTDADSASANQYSDDDFACSDDSTTSTDDSSESLSATSPSSSSDAAGKALLSRLAKRILERSEKKPSKAPAEAPTMHKPVLAVPPSVIDRIAVKTLMASIARACEETQEAASVPATLRDPSVTLALLANKIRDSTGPPKDSEEEAVFLDIDFLLSDEGRPLLSRRFLAQATSGLATVQVERMRLARAALATTANANSDGHDGGERPNVVLAVQEAVASAEGVLDAVRRVYGDDATASIGSSDHDKTSCDGATGESA